jgi:hypothetical protein
MDVKPMSKNEHNTVIPLIGGPLDGESITMMDGRLPNDVPLFFEKEFYHYRLFVEQSDDWTNIMYKYANQKVPLNSEQYESN